MTIPTANDKPKEISLYFFFKNNGDINFFIYCNICDGDIYLNKETGLWECGSCMREFTSSQIVSLFSQLKSLLTNAINGLNPQTETSITKDTKWDLKTWLKGVARRLLSRLQ